MDDTDVKRQQPVLSINFMTPPRQWTGAWQEFLRTHTGWRLAAGSEPVYSLPEQAIRSLTMPQGATPALLDKNDAAAERAFTQLCRLHYAVGSWEGQPIWYDLLQPAGALPASLLQRMGWTPQQQAAAKRLAAGSEQRRQRLKGCAGWLLTEPAYVEQAKALSEQWQAFQPKQRPPFPLGSVWPLPGRTTRKPSPGVVQFGDAFRAFLSRWGLMQMATWDLPSPQGPLLPNPLPSGAPALPAHGIHLVIPLHYALQGDDDLQRQILNLQRQKARELGLSESLAGLPHHKAYATLFDVLHLERAIRARLRSGQPPQGFVTQLEAAIAAELHCSLAKVKKCRKAISLCRRGRRSSVAWLRPRNR